MSDSTVVDPGGGDDRNSGGTGQPQQPQESTSQVRPGQTFAGAAQAASGTVPGGRSWLQIYAEAKEKRNILEIHVIRENKSNGNETQDRPKTLTNDEISEFIFEVLKIKETDCTGLDYFYGHKEIELKAGVDVSQYLHVNNPIKFHDYNIIVKRQETNHATKVLFRNVPLNVPDEELLLLALCYGQPVGGVKRERLTNPKDRGKLSSMHSIDVLLNDGS